MSQIHHETLQNGLHLVVEPMAGVKSLAMTLLCPGGAALEPQNKLGVSTLLSEMLERGAGGRSAREHSDALDQLGVSRSTDNSIYHQTLRATMVSDKATRAMPLLLDMMLRPNLADESFEPAADLCLQALASLADEPQQQIGELIRHQHQPEPFGRSTFGEAAAIKAMKVEDVRQFASQVLVPDGAILSLAGDIDAAGAKALIEPLIENWQGQSQPEPEPTPAARGYHHQSSSSAQVHIALAMDAPPEKSENSLTQKVAVSVLSGGMSGRLFTEVREKRGLCYAVYARYSGQRVRGVITGYAGTTPERAQQTLDVFVAELKHLSQGVDESEFQRAIVGIKSQLVMQGESSSARSRAIASDVFLIGRPRSLDEHSAAVDAMTLDQLNAYVESNVLENMTIVTLGPDPLQV